MCNKGFKKPRASEAVLLPYRKITGSGALLSAWTLGRGVICSDLPYFREMLDRGEAGLTVRPGDPAALAEGVRAWLARPATTRQEAARRAARRYEWSEVVRPVVEWLR